MMGRPARIAGIVLVGVACACNAISGADGLGTDPSTDQAPLPTRHRDENASSSSGENLQSSSSTSSSGGASSSGDPSTDDGGDPTNDAGADAPPIFVDPNFFDPFTRADDANVGNGWIEKTDVFSIVGNAVRQTGSGSYKNFFARRPAGEAVLDVEASVDVKHSVLGGDPGVYARVQPASSTQGTLVGYTFYAYFDEAFLDRDDGAGTNQVTALASQLISPAFSAPYTYTLSLKVTGTNPVHIVAQVKDANGNVRVNLDVNDASPGRITTPGTVGFGSGIADGAIYDNFKRTSL